MENFLNPKNQFPDFMAMLPPQIKEAMSRNAPPQQLKEMLLTHAQNIEQMANSQKTQTADPSLIQERDILKDQLTKRLQKLENTGHSFK